MEDDFYATIKLVSGEEIFSKVCPCEEEDRIILILENPVIMEEISLPGVDHSIMTINPWIKFSNDEIYFIHMDKIITMTEVKSKEILKIYNKYLKNKNKTTKKINATSNMGFISSVDDARKSLEKLYKSN